MQSRAPLLRIGTRGSALALAQANMVRDALVRQHGLAPTDVEIVTFTTTGDRLTDRPLSEAGGKGLFSKEIEEALLAGAVDVGVHSSKDMATTLPAGLELAVFLEREDIRDAFVSLRYADLDALPRGARFGTSSIRRAAQMLRHRPDLQIVPFRGNVGTRLRKLGDGVAEATLLAVAGLKRLGEAGRITAMLDPRVFMPAPAQGAVGLEIRAADARVRALVGPLDHVETSIAVRAERAMLKVLDGSCRTPIGAFSERDGDRLRLSGEILSPDGREAFSASAEGSADTPEALGARVGRELLERAGPAFVARFSAP